MTSRPPPSRAPSGTAVNPVRRNLFHNHHLIRRPTGATAAGATTASNVSSSSTAMPEVSRYDDTSDIVMRDHNGDPQYQMPQLSLPMVDEQNGSGGTEEEKERMSTIVLVHFRGWKQWLTFALVQGLEERILETYKSRSLVPGDKAELLSAIQASLRRKVAALAEDNWMYEAEATRIG
ncbi:MAG: hypothetical protein Q9192_001894 [Flavoplaca navasiana]